MSSETDHPRQRTVAELLAEHGDAGATGRRRRRREADGSVVGATPPGPESAAAVETGSGTPAWQSEATPPDRAILREPVPRGAAPLPRREVQHREAVERPRAFVPDPVPDVPRPVAPAPRADPDGSVRSGVGAPLGYRPPSDPARDRPTDKLPRIRDTGPGVLDPGLTGPIDHQRSAERVEELDGPRDAEDESDLFAAPANAPQPTETSRRAPDLGNTGPPTQAGNPPLDFDDFDDHPAGLGTAEVPEDGAGTGEDVTPKRRLGRTAGSTSTGQAWMAVVAQWIVGAVGGAALWVGFRFMWRELPVVALAAAVLVTVGLVLVVRALLRNNDMRTTVFAVLVGLLLTVSPALLVLLGR